jgi:hypothetical protein
MPSGAEKVGSNHRERPREHSRKPDHYRSMIQHMTGNLPVLELFARVDDEHPLPDGWEALGNQASAKRTAAKFEFLPLAGMLPDASETAPIGAVSQDPTPQTDDGLDIPDCLRRGHPNCFVQRDDNPPKPTSWRVS